MKYWLVLFIASFFNAYGSIFLKQSSYNGIGTKTHLFYVAMGVTFFASNFVLYSFALRGLKLSIAYPILVALGLLIILFDNMLFRGLQVTMLQIIGSVLVVSGIFILVAK